MKELRRFGIVDGNCVLRRIGNLKIIAFLKMVLNKPTFLFLLIENFHLIKILDPEFSIQ